MKVEDYLKKVAYKDFIQIGPESEPDSEVWKSNFVAIRIQSEI